eukprot:g3615.t1
MRRALSKTAGVPNSKASSDRDLQQAAEAKAARRIQAALGVDASKHSTTRAAAQAMLARAGQDARCGLDEKQNREHNEKMESFLDETAQFYIRRGASENNIHVGKIIGNRSHPVVAVAMGFFPPTSKQVRARCRTDTDHGSIVWMVNLLDHAEEDEPGDGADDEHESSFGCLLWLDISAISSDVFSSDGSRIEPKANIAKLHEELVDTDSGETLEEFRAKCDARTMGAIKLAAENCITGGCIPVFGNGCDAALWLAKQAAVADYFMMMPPMLHGEIFVMMFVDPRTRLHPVTEEMREDAKQVAGWASTCSAGESISFKFNDKKTGVY